jgi:hypothetical protein
MDIYCARARQLPKSPSMLRPTPDYGQSTSCNPLGLRVITNVKLCRRQIEKMQTNY